MSTVGTLGDKMNIISLLAHPITDTTTGITYEPSGIVLRADSKPTKQEGYNGLYVCSYEYVLNVPLPEPKPNTIYVVSNMAMNAIPKHRTDIVSPGPAEKNKETRTIVGCRGFRTIA